MGFNYICFCCMMRLILQMNAFFIYQVTNKKKFVSQLSFFAKNDFTQVNSGCIFFFLTRVCCSL